MVKVSKPKGQNEGGKGNKRSKPAKGKNVGTAGLAGVKKKKNKTMIVAKKAIVDANVISNGAKPTKAQMRRLRKKMLKKGMGDRDDVPKSANDAKQKRKNADREGKVQTKKQKKGAEQKPSNRAKKDGTLKAFMMNLPKSAKPDAVRNALSNEGVEGLEGLNIVSGKKKTYGVLIFKTPENLSDAVNASKKIIIDGKTVIIRPFGEKKKKEGESNGEEAGEGSEKEGDEEADDVDENSDDDDDDDMGEVEPSQPKGKNNQDVIIKNLDQGVTSDQLKVALEKKGLAVSSSKVTDKGPFTSGVVSFATEADCKKAVAFDKKITLNGKAIRIMTSGKQGTPSPSNNKTPGNKKQKQTPNSTEVAKGDESPKSKGGKAAGPRRSSPRGAAQENSLKGTKGGGVQKNQAGAKGGESQTSKKAIRRKVKKKVLQKAS